MYPEIEQKRSGFGGAIFVVGVLSLMGYLVFAAVQGEYGLFRLFQIEAQEKRLLVDLESLRAERLAIANKTARLSSGSLDLDLLDERARAVLGLGRPDEVIIR